jgi:Zn-dependent peptidase ImmA (M78 family)
LEDLSRTLSGALAPSFSERIEIQKRFLHTVFGPVNEERRLEYLKVWADALIRKSCHSKPPIRLAQIAKCLHARIELIDMSSWGRLIFKEDTPSKVFLNKTIGRGAQRFTLAHELAHLVMRQIVQRKVREIATRQTLFTWGSSEEQERLCNIMASHLIMPSPLFSEAIENSKLRGFALVSALARQFDTSKSASLFRLIDSNAPYVAIQWRLAVRPGSTMKLRVMWSHCPPGRSLPFIPNFKPTADQNLNRVLTSRRACSADIDLSSLRLGSELYQADLKPYKDGILGLVYLNQEKWPLVPIQVDKGAARVSVSGVRLVKKPSLLRD